MCIEFVVEKDFPLIKVDSEDFRNQMNAENTLKLTVQDTMLHVGEDVEGNLTKYI